jgi:hypothetical protein
MRTEKSNNDNGPIRVIVNQEGFVVPCMREAHKLFSMIKVEHLGFGDFGARGFDFVRVGEYDPGFFKEPEVRARFTDEDLGGRYHACFRPLEEFKKEFPQVHIQIVN